MSTLAYATITARREAAPPGTSMTPGAVAPGGAPAVGPGVGAWIDAATALVPAEVLAVHAFLIQQVTSTTKDAAGHTVVTISSVGNAQLLFWILLALSSAIYVGAHVKSWDRGWDFVRMLIPAAAFVLWSALQNGTAFDAVASWSEFTRYLVGVIGVIVLGYAAKVLAYKADAKPLA
jgi:hypothetical protein